MMTDDPHLSQPFRRIYRVGGDIKRKWDGGMTEPEVERVRAELDNLQEWRVGTVTAESLSSVLRRLEDLKGWPGAREWGEEIENEISDVRAHLQQGTTTDRVEN